MRIESNVRTGAASRGGITRAGGGASFVVDDGGSAARAEFVSPALSAGGIDALIALQSVDDPLRAKRKAVRRGTALLDTLETIKADLLLGRVSEGRLNQLMALIGQARERRLPEIDAVLDDIELRARVELAKFGRYPGL